MVGGARGGAHGAAAPAGGSRAPGSHAMRRAYTAQYATMPREVASVRRGIVGRQRGASCRACASESKRRESKRRRAGVCTAVDVEEQPADRRRGLHADSDVELRAATGRREQRKRHRHVRDLRRAEAVEARARRRDGRRHAQRRLDHEREELRVDPRRVQQQPLALALAMSVRVAVAVAAVGAAVGALAVRRAGLVEQLRDGRLAVRRRRLAR
eukprot:5104794-Prymnesium_polylepis.2